LLPFRLEEIIQPARHPDLEPTAEPPAEVALQAESASIGRSSVRGFLWTTLAWGCNRLAILALTLLLARLLTPQDFGVVTAALTVIVMLDAALDLGLGAAVISDQESGISHRIRTAFTLNLAIAVLIAIAGAVSSPWIAALFHAEADSQVFALIFLYPLFRGAGQVNDAVLKRDLRFRRRTSVDVVRAIVRVAVSIPMALSIGGAVSIATGIVAGELAAMALLWLTVPIRPYLRLNLATVSGLLSFGGQVTVIRVLGSFRSSVDYLVVGAALGVTALGFYGMAYKLPELLIENVLWIFSAIALPAYSRARAAGHDALLVAMLRATRLLALYGLAVGTALCVLARDAVPVLFSERWTPAVVPTMIISLSLGIMAIAWASGDVFSAMGRPGALLLLDVPATLLMAAAFLLAPRWGLVGVAAVHLIFNCCYCAARLGLLRAVTRVSVRSLFAAVLPGLGVAALTAVAGFGVAAVLPSGQLSSLVLLGAVCALAIAAGSLLFARGPVLDALRTALPMRGGRT
jgi:lipopolysaccharide exporter